jgi:hypothetical protein
MAAHDMSSSISSVIKYQDTTKESPLCYLGILESSYFSCLERSCCQQNYQERTRDWLIATRSGSEAVVLRVIAKNSLFSRLQAWQPNGLSICNIYL